MKKNSGEKLFGTDGIRGRANHYPMTPEIALKVGKAVAKFFMKKNGKMHRIVIGKDTRLSGYMLETALTSGIVSMGVDVLLVGPMPTPAIAKLTVSMNADAGIVLSASHNPADDNGIKIFDSKGFKLDDASEQEIEHIVLNETDALAGSSKIGKAYRINEAKGRYIEFAKSTIDDTALNGLKVVVDCANGAAYSVAPQIFSELGADVIAINNSPSGTNINLGCGALHPESMCALVKKHKADLGIALDGDADRAVFCNEKGEIVNGDSVLAMAAIELKKRNLLSKNTVVVTVMSNIGMLKFLEKNKINCVIAAVGDRYVIDEMKKGNYSFGGEQSGHLIFKEYSTTGDGIVSALQLLRLMKSTGKKLSQLTSKIEFYPQVLLNVNVGEKKPIKEMPEVQRKIKEAGKQLGNNGRVFVRYSGTEKIARVMVEGRNKKTVDGLARQIAGAIKKEVGVR
jgi:phosphoglucosamine mutase